MFFLHSSKSYLINTRRLFFVLIFCVTVSFMPENGNAWNYPGSVLIAEIAYQHLNADKKKQVDQLAEIMFNDLLLKQRIKLNREYETVSTFAKLAVMADVFRKLEYVKII